MSALEMNPEIRARWVAALRSGEYSQAKGALRRDDQFCCLGVLCNLAEAEGVVTGVPTGTNGEWSFSGNTEYLPLSVVAWSGLLDQSPHVDLNGQLEPLAFLNDEGRSFAEIADLIEGTSQDGGQS